MNIVVQLAWAFIDGLFAPWKFVAFTTWSLLWWTTLSGINFAWRVLSSPLRFLTAAWRAQQAEEKVVVLQSKIRTMTHTILDLEKNLEIAQTERLRMRDKLEKALEDRKNFYERAVRAIAKVQKLKKEVTDRVQVELLERATDADSDRPEMDVKSEAHAEDGDCHLEHVQSEDLGVEQELEAVPDLSLSGSQEVKQPSICEDAKPGTVGETEHAIDESDSGGPIVQKAEKVSRKVDKKMRTAGAASSILCAVLALVGGVITTVTAPLGGNNQAAYAITLGLTSVVLLAIWSAYLFVRLRGKSKKQRGHKGKASGGVNAVLMLSLIWLCLGFLAYPALQDSVSSAIKNPAMEVNGIIQKYGSRVTVVAEKLMELGRRVSARSGGAMDEK